MSTVRELSRALPTVGLEHLVETADLQQRVDRKYVVRDTDLAAILADAAARGACDLRVLDIAGRRSFGYDSVYFDTPALSCFGHHVQGRRRRAKVRTRTYVDSGDCVLEVKQADGRGTVKHRLPWRPEDGARLGATGREFVSTYAPQLDGLTLVPVVDTLYRRTTLLVDESSRVTIDAELTVRQRDRSRSIDPGTLVVETKTAGPPGPVDRALAGHGHRPRSISKYCLAVALLEPGATTNPWRRIMRAHFGWSPAAAAARPQGETHVTLPGPARTPAVTVA